VTFASSRKFPGQNPVNWLTEQVGDLFGHVARLVRGRRAARSPQSG
jgi:hypothetical protein